MRRRAFSYMTGIACGMLLGVLVTYIGADLIGRAFRSPFDADVIGLNERIAARETHPGRVEWIGSSMNGDQAER